MILYTFRREYTIYLYMVYNNKTSHIITGNLRWSDARYIFVFAREFLLCQIRKTATQSKIFVQKTEKSHLCMLVCGCVYFELDHSIHSFIYFTLVNQCHRCCMVLNRKETIRCVANFIQTNILYTYFVQIKHQSLPSSLFHYTIYFFRSSCVIDIVQYIRACSKFKYMNTKFHIQAVRSYL